MRICLTKGRKLTVFFALFALFAASVAAQPGSGNIKLRRALDYDNDGRADYAVFRPDGGNWFIVQSSGGFTGQPFGVANEDFLTPGDYDGDGKGDIAVFRDSIGVWFRIDSSTNTFRAMQWGMLGDEPVARDYDGDGSTDLAVVRRSNGVMTWFIQGSAGGFFGSQWGAATDFTAPGDYDGDGKFDLAVQRPGPTLTSEAIFHIFRSSDNAHQAFGWGYGTDLNVPGDYDGDGKTDIAVIREGETPESSLTWYISRSSDGVLVGIPWGATGTDLNVQNDYDGDNITDIAVWRNTNGIFYVLGSSSGFTGYQWGAPSDFPIASHDTH